jgi:hypothetical protein
MREDRTAALTDEAAMLQRMAALARLDDRDDLAEQFEAMAKADETEADR